MTDGPEPEVIGSERRSSAGVERAVQDAVSLLEAMKQDVNMVEAFIDRLPYGSDRIEDFKLLSELRADTTELERTLEYYSYPMAAHRHQATI